MVVMYWIIGVVLAYILRCIALNQALIARNQVKIYGLLKEMNGSIKKTNENKTTQED